MKGHGGRRRRGAIAKSPFEIVLGGEEHAELERRVACYTLPFKVVQRAKIVLYAADGLGNAGTPPVLWLRCGG